MQILNLIGTWRHGPLQTHKSTTKQVSGHCKAAFIQKADADGAALDPCGVPIMNQQFRNLVRQY
jgi:hypothetical protein